MTVLRQILGRQVRFGGEEHSGWLPDEASTPQATPVEQISLDFRIVELSTGGFLLEWEGPTPKHTGDTWHQSLDDAVAQAEVAFGIEPEEWQAPKT